MTRKIYVASRASVPERSRMWRLFRNDGAPIVSTWIDEAGEGQTEDMGELWERIVGEITSADALVLYAEPSDVPLKGAFVEVGIALALKKQIIVSLPGFGPLPREIGSWQRHASVLRIDNIGAALYAAENGVSK